MWDWIKQLDRVLRGEATRVTDLRSKTIDIPVAGLSVVIVVLGMIYGVCMGCYALAVLASFGPIVAFFCLCTTSYSFIKILNVVVFAAAGGLGLTFLLQTLHRLSIAQGVIETAPERLTHDAMSPPTDAPESSVAEDLKPDEEVGALDQLGQHVLGRHVKVVFGCWVVVFGLVGAQMGWVLRPFIGLFGGQGAVVAHRNVCHWVAQFLRHQHALRSAE